MNHKSRIAIALVTMTLIILIASARATVYNPGVSAGQWIKYGNVVIAGNLTSSGLINVDWIEAEIVDVSGKNVTLHVSGQYKNGTSMEEGGMVIDVETGTLNGSVANVGGFFLIAGNLQANDSLPSATPSLSPKINETVTRTYLGTSRTVNVINITQSPPDVHYTYFMVFDQASGVLLEMNTTTTETRPPMNFRLSLSVIDTNIFAGGILSPKWLQDNMIYVIIAVVAIIIVIVAAIALTWRRKPPPTQATVRTPPPPPQT